MERLPGQGAVVVARCCTAETGQRLIAYCAAPGSATEAAFAELAARAPLTV